MFCQHISPYTWDRCQGKPRSCYCSPSICRCCILSLSLYSWNDFFPSVLDTKLYTFCTCSTQHHERGCHPNPPWWCQTLAAADFSVVLSQSATFHQSSLLFHFWPTMYNVIYIYQKSKCHLNVATLLDFHGPSRPNKKSKNLLTSHNKHTDQFTLFWS